MLSQEEQLDGTAPPLPAPASTPLLPLVPVEDEAAGEGAAEVSAAGSAEGAGEAATEGSAETAADGSVPVSVDAAEPSVEAGSCLYTWRNCLADDVDARERTKRRARERLYMVEGAGEDRGSKRGLATTIEMCVCGRGDARRDSSEIPWD